MYSRMIGGCLFAMMSACAGANRNAVPADLQRADGSPGLFVGHTNYGEVVVAATHYDAMSGLATTDTDLGLPARKDGSGKMLVRAVNDDERTLQTLGDCAAAVTALSRRGLPAFVEPLPMRTSLAGTSTHREYSTNYTTAELVKWAGICAALGETSQYTWLAV